MTGQTTSIASATIAIVGVARSCAGAIGPTVDALMAATAGFREREVVIVESDSSDGTVRELERLQGNRQLQFRSEGRLSSTMPLRTQRIAHCRNLLVDEIARKGPNAPDYVMVADFDGVNGLVTRDAVESCWERGFAWDVVTANQTEGYYDIWALRHAVWSPGDCWSAVRELTPIMGKEAARHLAIDARQVRIPEGTAPFEVDSAFGGLAIYRREAFLAGRYAGLDGDGREICEHVPYHASLRAAGHRIVLNPRLVNSSQSEHTDRASTALGRAAAKARRTILRR